MDDGGTMLADGVVYLERGEITAVGDAAAAPPAGFEQVAVLATDGTIYPGLIELHNHLSYKCCGCGRCRNATATAISGARTRTIAN